MMKAFSTSLHFRSRAVFGFCCLGAFLSALPSGRAHHFINATEANPDAVTHATGYNGTGGHRTIQVGLFAFNPGSFNTDAAISVQNAILRWNELTATTGNLDPNGLADPTQQDFESIILHEIGHALGLGHPNVEASQVDPAIDQSAAAANGPNGTPNYGAGADGLFGTADDNRDDDVNLLWRPISNNNPFTIPSVVDESTYTLDTSTEWPNVPTREVALSEFGLANTEAVMVQGATPGETHRLLGHDDVAGVRFAMAGLDGTQGTADDYTFSLEFVPSAFSADILIQAQPTTGNLAETSSSSTQIGGSNHFSINPGATISVNTNVNWFFNSTPAPEPSTLVFLGAASVLLLRRRRVSP